MAALHKQGPGRLSEKFFWFSQRHIDGQRATFSGLPADLAAWRSAGFPGGSPAEVTEQLKAFEAAGVSRFMLQQNDLDDITSLELLTSEVLPHFQ